MYVIKPIRNNKGNIFARKVQCVFGKKMYGVWRYVFVKEKVIFFPTLKKPNNKKSNKTVSEWDRGEKKHRTNTYFLHYSTGNIFCVL